jgi:arylsulfatase A-like enzyme
VKTLLLFLTASIFPLAAVEKPNILFILADDLGKEWISCYGAEDIKTPNIDALAAGGMKFINAYSMPQCTPSRVTLMTGTYPWRSGWVNHWDVPRWGVGYFDAKQKRNTTVAKLMKEAGYATSAAGKWQINDFRIEPQAMKGHGFDDWLMWTGYETGVKASANRYDDPYINTPKGSEAVIGKFGPDLYADHTIRFMREHKGQPMFLYHALALPHGPLVATPDEPYAETNLDKHKAMVRYMDKQIGRMIAALDELDLRKKTIVIFTTDNGSTNGIIGTLKGEKVNGSKANKIEAGVNCPFIINAPGIVPAGVETDALTDFSDMLPTFLELAGGKLPENLKFDGVSLASTLQGKTKDSGREWIMALGHGDAKLDQKGVRGAHDFASRVIRDKQFKVWVSEEKKIIRLHDLAADPREATNLLDGELNNDQKAALKKFQTVVNSMPDQDARPIYEPRPANPWDRKMKNI